MIAIGIDTGGTCTDAVLYDLSEKRVLSFAKSPTTHGRLEDGITAALRSLDQDLVKEADYVSLSTTLATNACVEGKGCRAKLILIGIDEKTFRFSAGRNGLNDLSVVLRCDRKDPADPMSEPDWDKLFEYTDGWLRDAEGLGVVEFNSPKSGAVAETEAKKRMTERYGIPVISGSELFSDLNMFKRGSGALLNARLVPIIKDFLKAVKTSLKELGIEAPIAVVRSDASVMNEESARDYPVETILCGPAASVLGSMHLAGSRNAVIVDMGGTTTDIAVVRNGEPVTADGGISIGGWKTFVKGMKIETIGLGGDTRVHVDIGKIKLDEIRVEPLSMTALKFPEIKDMMSRAVNRVSFMDSMPPCEFYYCEKESGEGLSVKEKLILDTIGDGIISAEDLSKKTDISMYDIAPLRRLISEGVIRKCGVTPTDMMHAAGDFTAYDAEAGKLAAEYTAMACFDEDDIKSPADAIDRVYDMVRKRMYIHVASVLLKERYPALKGEEPGRQIMSVLSDDWDSIRDRRKEIAGMNVRTDAALIGIGAPVHLFIKEVAAALGTECVLPPYAGVANAIGAVAGSIETEVTVRIGYEKDDDNPMIRRYVVYAGPDIKIFETWDEAVEAAGEYASGKAIEDAERRGGCDMSVRLKVTHNTSNMGLSDSLELGGEVTARAVSGSMRL